MGRIPQSLIQSLENRIGLACQPATNGTFSGAELNLGRPLPEDLRQIYCLGDGGWGPGDGLMPLAEAIANYQELCSKPFGPLEQPWPASLFPLYEEVRVPVCYDLSNGKIIAWEADRIEDIDSPEEFDSSFVEEAESLSELLSDWVGSESFDQMRDRMWRETMANAERRGVSPVTGFPNQFDDPEEQAKGEIAFLANQPEMRADFGLPEEDWEMDIRRRHGLDPS